MHNKRSSDRPAADKGQHAQSSYVNPLCQWARDLRSFENCISHRFQNITCATERWCLFPPGYPVRTSVSARCNCGAQSPSRPDHLTGSSTLVKTAKYQISRLVWSANSHFSLCGIERFELANSRVFVRFLCCDVCFEEKGCHVCLCVCPWRLYHGSQNPEKKPRKTLASVQKVGT